MPHHSESCSVPVSDSGGGGGGGGVRSVGPCDALRQCTQSNERCHPVKSTQCALIQTACLDEQSISRGAEECDEGLWVNGRALKNTPQTTMDFGLYCLTALSSGPTQNTVALTGNWGPNQLEPLNRSHFCC